MRELLEDLDGALPALGARIYDDGEIAPFVNVYVDGEDVRTRGGLDTPVRDGIDGDPPARHGGREWPLSTSTVAASLLDLIGNTPLVELPHFSPEAVGPHLREARGPEPDRLDQGPDRARDGRRRATLEPGTQLLEPTSGNTGISLALVASCAATALTCVMPANATPERRRLLELYGAKIVDSPGEEGSNGAVRLAQELAAARPVATFMPFQYANEANPRAHYEGTGAEIVRGAARVDALVAGLGTGGTLMGAGARLREAGRTSSSPRPSRSRATR